MSRNTLLSTLGLIALAAGATAQSPASFFEQPNFDSWLRTRGPLLTHHYKLTNTSQQQVHISGARVSCGCVAAQAVKDTLAPGESTSIYATMDTRRFTGPKQVTIYVAFDRPVWQEVSLSISAYQRDDLSMDAEGITFGTVSRGSAGNAKMNITLRQANWAVQGAAPAKARLWCRR